MKKVFGQTVRDLKREVNKKVLKVPGIEQKILDATSNEPWGPHGSHLADIAQATRNFHEYQIIMTVIWKRINDTGKNWRHVFKALTVLEYLVANGSERVIDEIWEHAYQISTLSNFQYTDSGGRDQGSNVRRKSQTLVALANDKERIQEVRQKALANKEKNGSPFSTGSTHRHSTGGSGDHYDDQSDGRYRYRDDDRDNHEKGRDYGYNDDDRYGRGGDKYNQDGNRYGKDYEERYGRDGYKDDDNRGYGNGNDDYRLGSRKSVDRYTDRSFDDDDRHSSRSGGGRADNNSQDDSRLEGQLSGQNVGGPPSYEEATRDAQNHLQNERDGGTVASPAHKSSSPPVPKSTSPSKSLSQSPDHVVPAVSPEAPNKELDAFDEFDPRGSVSATPPTALSPELDFFGSLPASDSTNSLVLFPVTPAANTTSTADIPTNSALETNFESSTQPYENPFGDSPFKATPQENFPPVASNVETVTGFDFGDPLGDLTFAPTAASGQPFSANPGFSAPELPLALISSSSDVLADLFPQTGTADLVYSQAAQPTAPTTPPMEFHPQSGPSAVFPPQGSGPLAVFPPQEAQPAGPNNMQLGQLNLQQGSFYSQTAQLEAPNNMQSPYLNLQPPGLSTSASLPSFAAPIYSQAIQPSAQNNAHSAHFNLLQEPGLPMPLASPAPLTTGGPSAKFQPSKERFEPKSAVWTDTLSRGLVDLNISGAKINPLADIGIDFDAINRKEKRKEVKSSAAPPVASTTMGKAMGSGSGVGRATASGIAPPPNPMMGSGMGGMGMGMGMGMGSYGVSINQPPVGPGMGMNMGMGMGMNMGMNMGMGMGMGMGQRGPMGPPPGMPPPGSGVGYNPMMGTGNYGLQQQPYRGGPQQPYGGGYR